LSSSAAIAATIPAWTAVTSHPSFSGSAVLYLIAAGVAVYDEHLKLNLGLVPDSQVLADAGEDP
jgi:hypothetical protein